MAIARAVALCLGSGYLVVGSAWPGRAQDRAEWAIMLFLAPGFGIGAFSIVFLFARFVGINHLLITAAAVTAALAGVYLVRRAQNVRVIPRRPDVTEPELPHRLRYFLRASFALAILATLYAGVRRTLAHPHGDGWDAFAIWNLHARFLYLGGAHWRDGFSPLIPWSHPDHPFLIPGAIAYFWTCLGNDSPIVPSMLSLVFMYSTIGLLVAAVARLRGRLCAMFAGLALASTPFFIEHGTSQYADVPLSFFLLASIVLLHLHEEHATIGTGASSTLVLAGLAASLIAWTKNEGLLVLLAFVASQALFRWKRSAASGEIRGAQRAEFISLLLGTIPGILLIVWFKHFLAPAGDLLSRQQTITQKILTPGRYWIIVQWYVKEFFRFGNWIVPTSLLMILLAWSEGVKRRIRNNMLGSSILMLALILAGYFAVYVIIPDEIRWHDHGLQQDLRFSLNRLFLQLWPSTIFLFFLAIPGSPTTEYSET